MPATLVGIYGAHLAVRGALHTVIKLTEGDLLELERKRVEHNRNKEPV